MKIIINYIRNRYWKNWIRKHKCKVSGGLHSLHKRSTLRLEEGVSLGHMIIEPKNLKICAHTYIRSDCVLTAVSSIGRFCSIGTGCVIGQEKGGHPSTWLSSHPFQYTNTGLTYDPEISDVTIGHDVWIGHSAMIMEGVTVGTGAIIATRSVVAHDVPPYAVVAGLPAKVVKYRHTPEMISQLLNSKWWDCEIDSLRDLPLNDPTAALPMLEELRKEKPARYQEIQVTRRGCCVVAN